MRPESRVYWTCLPVHKAALSFPDYRVLVVKVHKLPRGGVPPSVASHPRPEPLWAPVRPCSLRGQGDGWFTRFLSRFVRTTRAVIVPTKQRVAW